MYLRIFYLFIYLCHLGLYINQGPSQLGKFTNGQYYYGIRMAHTQIIMIWA